MQTLTDKDIKATNALQGILAKRGIKTSYTISKKTLVNLGFTPVVELYNGYYWNVSDLNKAADIIASNPNPIDEIRSSHKEKVNTFDAMKINYRLESLEKKLEQIIQKLG